MTPAEALRAAADVLERDGWCQGELRNHEGRRCLVGAVSAIRDDTAAFNVAYPALACHVGLPGILAIASWNDDPSRTAEEVITALRKTAAELEGKG